MKYLFSLSILILPITTIATAQKADTAKKTKTVTTALKVEEAKKDTLAKKDTVKHKKASLKVGLTYSNNAVYLARTDSVATPNWGLGVTYTLKSGIFFEGMV